jgi:hypothetical protein
MSGFENFLAALAEEGLQTPGEQPVLEEQSWSCWKCFSSHTVVADVSNTDSQFMCPDCMGPMRKT